MGGPPRCVVSLLLLGLFLSTTAWATLVPKMTLEQMVEGAELAVHGKVVRKWSGWDDSKKFIWTHYEVAVADSLKGGLRAKVVVSEPGGTVDGLSMMIAGAPQYEAGDEVVLLLNETPIGYFRTCGWGQGKFTVSEQDGVKTVSPASLGVQLVELAGKTSTVRRHAGVAAETLDGLALTDFKSRLRELIEGHSAKEGR